MVKWNIIIIFVAKIIGNKTMTPEERARVKIDQWFADAGWKVVNRDEYEPT